jgi:hypothetical protein
LASSLITTVIITKEGRLATALVDVYFELIELASASSWPSVKITLSLLVELRSGVSAWFAAAARHDGKL